jgi:inorganic pyrophosphatase
MAENFHCLVEIPKGSRNKYEWDEELQAIKLDRFLFASVVYPTDYGFIPQTLGEDGDPLDAMVVVTEPTFPGCMIPVKVIALFRMRDDKGVDDKVVCVPQHDPNWRHVEKLEDLSVTLRDEISHFFSIYKQPEGIAVKVDGWFPRDQAIEIIEEAKTRYREEGAGQPEAGPPPGEGDDDADADEDAETEDDTGTEDDAADDGETGAENPPSEDAADPKS